MSAPDTAGRRAARLVRLYPRSWRERHEQEFVELLREEMLERGRYAPSALDVVRGAWMARLAAAGIGVAGPCRTSPGSAALATAGCAVALFLASGMAMWSQLTIGWQWASPAGPAVAASIEVMSLALLALAPLALLALAPLVLAAAGPLVWCALRTLASGRAERLHEPVAAFFLGAVALGIGTVHFAHGWPGTGGHPWAGRGLVPGGLASLAGRQPGRSPPTGPIPPG